MEEVIDRIQLLEKENAELKSQLSQNKFQQIKDEKWAQNIIDCLPNPLFIKDENHCYVSLNRAFSELVNIKRQDLIGKSDIDFFSKAQSKIFIEVDKEVFATGKTNWNEEELTIGDVRHNLLTSKVRIEDGNKKKYKNQQALLIKKKNEVEKQKKHIQTLLKEVHHRVKNNLQLVSSLLNLQMSQFDEANTKNAFTNCKNRILAMSNVHEILYQTEDFVDINFKDYITPLVKNLTTSLRLEDDILFNIDADRISLNLETTMLLGLIVNEIVTNSVKHGISYHYPLEIYIKMNVNYINYCLEIGDNGIGIKEKINEKKTHLGLELIQLFAQQLDANLTQIEKKKGVHYLLKFKRD